MRALGDWAVHQLTEFLSGVSSSSTAEAALQRAVERAAEALEAEVGVYIEAQSIRAVVGFPAGKTPRAILLEAAASSPSGELDLPGLGRCFFVVVADDDEPGKTLMLARSHEPFTRAEVNLLMGMARALNLTLRTLRMLVSERELRRETQHQAGVNAQLLASLRTRQGLLEKLSLIQRSISHRAPLGEVLDAIVAGAAELFGGEVVGLRLVDENDPDFMVLVASSGISEEQRPILGRSPVADGIGGRAILEDRFVLTDDYRSAPDAMRSFAAWNLQTAMSAPVREEDRVVGSLVVASYRPGRRFSQDEQDTLEAFADHASLALTDSRTIEAIRAQTTFVKLLRSISTAANEAMSMDEAVRACLEIVCGHTGWGGGRAHILVDGAIVDSGPVLSWSRIGVDSTSFDLIPSHAVEPSIRELQLVERVASTREPVAFVPGAGPETGDPSHSLFLFPVVASKEVVAVLAFRAAGGAAPDEQLLQLMEHVGAQLGRAVQRNRLEQEIEFRALHDPLTGLSNRTLFLDRVTHALARRREDQASSAVLFIDLDDFKSVNDSLGHSAGDEFLEVVASRLRATLRPADTIARMGGDEFAILLEGAHAEEAESAAKRILEALGQHCSIQGQEMSPRASIGIAIAGAESSPAELLRSADVAMYSVKGDDSISYRVFEPEMHAAAVARLEMRADLQRALENKEFFLDYQPIVELSTDRIVGVEALLRWRHPKLGVIPPLDFIPLAEDSGLIVPIGQWVLTEAARQASEWRANRNGRRSLYVSVNLSARQIRESNFLRQVKDALSASGLSPDGLVLEITESILMGDVDATTRQLDDLRKLGIRIAIDDFGTGYSSLSYLKRFPVDMLKIDKAFVEDITLGVESAALVHAVVKVGETLGLHTVAEGIETSQEAERLRELGCGFGQGFHFARPMSPQALFAVLEGQDIVQADDAPNPRTRVGQPG